MYVTRQELKNQHQIICYTLFMIDELPNDSPPNVPAGVWDRDENLIHEIVDPKEEGDPDYESEGLVGDFLDSMQKIRASMVIRIEGEAKSNFIERTFDQNQIKIVFQEYDGTPDNPARDRIVIDEKSEKHPDELTRIIRDSGKTSIQIGTRDELEKNPAELKPDEDLKITDGIKLGVKVANNAIAEIFTEQ